MYRTVLAAYFAAPVKLALALHLLRCTDDVVAPSTAHNVTAIGALRGCVARPARSTQRPRDSAAVTKVG